MPVLLGTTDIPSAGGIYLGSTPADRVYRGADLVWERGRQLSDPFDALSAFTLATSGSGINVSGGAAQWAGSTDGQGIGNYNTQALTDNQYCAVQYGTTSSSRSSALIMHNDASNSGYYAVGFTTASVQLVRTSGRWQQNSITSIATSSTVPATGQWVECWNIGERFRVAVNGSIVIDTTISGALISGRRYQGFGLYRTSFASSGTLQAWRGGDAYAWGKAA